MSIYIYESPATSKSFYVYECFIVAGENEVQERPTGYIETTPSGIAGENCCMHVKPLLDRVSTPSGQFALGVSYGHPKCSEKPPLQCGVGINYRWIQSPYKPYDYYYYVVDGPGYSGHTSYRSSVRLHPPSGLSCSNLNKWFKLNAQRCGSSGSIYTSTYGWTKHKVSHVVYPRGVDRDLANSVIGSIPWSRSLKVQLDSLYYEAVGQLKFNMNNIANGTEIIRLLASLKSLNSLGREVSRAASKAVNKGIAKNAADAWLKYRYAYLTTKSDVEEFVQKAVALQDADTGVIHCGGSLDGFALNMKVAYRPYPNKCLNDLLEFVSMPKRLGLDPSLYNIWDLVPFSFVVDWFVPIGDNLERISSQTWAATMPYRTQMLASYKGVVEYRGESYRVYSRFDYSPTGEWSWISKDETSLLTATKRGLDVIALTR